MQGAPSISFSEERADIFRYYIDYLFTHVKLVPKLFRALEQFIATP